KEAAEGEQRFVHGTKLVDAQGGVADAAPATVLAAAATRERHQLDDALQDVVAQLDAVEQPGTGRVEQMALQRGDGEAAALRDVTRCRLNAGAQFLLSAARIAAREALPDEAEQLLQAVVEVVAVAGLVGGERGLFQLAQMLDAVALQIGFG